MVSVNKNIGSNLVFLVKRIYFPVFFHLLGYKKYFISHRVIIFLKIDMPKLSSQGCLVSHTKIQRYRT